MFKNLSERLSRVLYNIRGKGRLTENNINNTLREIRIALLEADVALSVVHDFINRVRQNALGQEINKNLTPGQTFIKIIHIELVHAMGNKDNTLNLAVQPPAVILMVGLHGSGKTTSIGKLSKHLCTKYNKKVLVVSADTCRPAAIKQLEILAQTAGVDFFPSDITQKPIDIINNALIQAKLKFYDVLLVDTAGRLHSDKMMMSEIVAVHNTISPVETIFVVDVMIGQDISNIANAFSQALPLTGIILTKLDSDTRGGAALSICHLTGKPIKFIGIGETIDALEPFYPDRLASRILGMGDVLSFIEEMENKIDSVQVEKLTRKLNQGIEFNLNDFFQQLQQMRNMGGIVNIMSKLPVSIGGQLPEDVKSRVDDGILMHMEAMINSMTTKELLNPNIIKGSRIRRIAVGSGMKIQDVNKFLKQFDYMQKMMKKIKKNGIINFMRCMKNRILPGLFLTVSCLIDI
ncbi:signal recognition particle protein [Candidatus Curculioniphilus buchneri]|uniref:signal recognition particle protein n=1 Tax=Candidatus Curculioniphilus buchneri TaxID=690594 RepID=UPI00376EEF24